MYDVIEREKMNPYYLKKEDFKEVVFVLSDKEKKARNTYLKKNLIIMSLVSVPGFLSIYGLFNNIGLGALIIFLYLFIHNWKLRTEMKKMEGNQYSKCNICQLELVRAPVYDSEDITHYFCKNCMTYFTIVEIWNRS
jgi:hypothetical protein